MTWDIRISPHGGFSKGNLREIYLDDKPPFLWVICLQILGLKLSQPTYTTSYIQYQQDIQVGWCPAVQPVTGISTKFSWNFFPASMVQPVTSSWEEYRLDMPFGTSYPLEVDPTHQLCGAQDDYPNARKKIPCDEHPMADVWSPGFFFSEKKKRRKK